MGNKGASSFALFKKRGEGGKNVDLFAPPRRKGVWDASDERGKQGLDKYATRPRKGGEGGIRLVNPTHSRRKAPKKKGDHRF